MKKFDDFKEEYQVYGRIVRIKSLFDVVRIIAAHVCVNAAQLELVLLRDFKENMLNCSAEVNAASENMLEVTTASEYQVNAASYYALQVRVLADHESSREQGGSDGIENVEINLEAASLHSGLPENRGMISLHSISLIPCSDEVRYVVVVVVVDGCGLVESTGVLDNE
ncbi:hypothetical protein Tco_0299205 [Tanacetum coccineum]